MKSIAEIYTRRNRGPWSIPPRLETELGHRERSILASRTCEAFPHHLNRDTDFYTGDKCITYYCPTLGAFTLDTGTGKIIG
jgi:Zn-finger protein